MNSYQVCLSVLALCFCLAGAVTKGELERLIHQTNTAVRVHGLISIQNASRDALLSATTPEQKVCITTKIGPAHRDVNIALSTEMFVVQMEYRMKTPEEIEAIDAVTLAPELRERYTKASPAQSWIDQINQC